MRSSLFSQRLFGAEGRRAVELVTTTDGRAYSRDTALVIPNAQWLLGYEQIQAQVEAQHANPQAAALRESSQSQFEGLRAGDAAKLAETAFPTLVGHPAGRPPLTRGEHIARYVSEYAAAVTMPGGKRAVIASGEPLATKTRSGQRPIDLRLHRSREGFAPAVPANGVHLRIPSHVSAGAGLANLGITLTPVDSHGAALHGATGVIDGATAFYGNTERAAAGVLDTDTLVKPEATGLSVETILRSERSPKKLHFKVGLPGGARLVHAHGSSTVEVFRGARAIASIAAPTAQDAEGTAIALSLGVIGHVLTVTMDRRPGQYRLPIVVDPKVTDWQLNVSGVKPTNWHFEHTGGSGFTASENTEGKGWTEHISASHGEHETGEFVYTTQGTSYITKLTMEGIWNDTSTNVENLLLLVSPSGVAEGTSSMPASWSSGGTWGVCAPQPECFGKKPAAGNSAEWLQTSLGTGTAAGENTLQKTTILIEQPTGPELSFNKTSPTLEGGLTNILYGSGAWLGPATGFEANAYDPGMGISFFGISGGMKGYGEKFAILENGECLGGVQCEQHFNQVLGYSPLLPDGEVSLEAFAYDASNSYAMVWPLKIKVDGTPPHNIVLTGLPEGNEIGYKSYTLKAEASDGSTNPSSGIKSIGLKVDGHEIGTASGSCSPGPCTAKSYSWTINGQEYAAGLHTLVVTATDNAGNTETEEFAVTVRVTSPVALAPGEVNPRSGEFSLGETDVSQGEGLTISRSYLSQHLKAGVAGPLGPQWAIGMGSSESLEPQPEGGVVLTDDNGLQAIFAANGSGGFNSPPGDSNLTLSYHEAGGTKEYILANAAKKTSTRFTLPSGGGTLWMPTVQEGASATDTTTYTYETVEISGKKVTRPALALAPVPSGVSCSPELKRGCRALTFNYASSTTATGENESQWGDYKGNLTRVYLTAYEPTAGNMSTKTIAQYSYDSQGRLRAEWDPLVSPALKTIYGYDSEGHVTALTLPGQETYAFTYAQAPTDLVSGRIQRVTRAPASASLWAGTIPANTVAPALTPAEPALGITVSVSTGTWSGNPVAYRYQWQRCNASGGECVAIPGARNEAYKPMLADAAHSLKVEVQATNGGGSIVAYSAATKVIASALSYQSKFGTSGEGNGQFKWAQGVAVDSSGNVWVADTFNNRVQEFNSSGTYTRQFGTTGTGNGQFKEPFGIAINSEGNLWVTDAGNNRVQEFSSTGTYIKQFGSIGSGAGQFSSPQGITITPEGNIWVADTKNNRIEEFSSTGTYERAAGSSGSGAGQLSGPKGVASDASGNIWVTDSKNNRVEEFSTTGGYVRQFGSEGSGHGQFKETRGITVDSTGVLWVTDKTSGRVQGFNASGEFLTQYGGSGQFNEPEGIAVTGSGTIYVADTSNQAIQMLHLSNFTPLSYASKFSAYGGGVEPTSWQQDLVFDASGNVWVADALNNRIEEFNAAGTYLKAIGSAGSGNGQLNTPSGLALTSQGYVWVADTYNNRIEEFEPNGKYIRQFGSAGSGEGQFNLPRGIRIFPGTGYIAVADQGNNRVQVFNTTGGFIREIKGTGSNQLNTPEALAIDAESHLWVGDAGHNRIEEFSSTGEYIRQFGSAGGGRGQFNGPSGLTVDGSGNVWVTDTFNDRLEGFTSTGEFLAEYGGWGTGNGQFYDLNAVAVNSTGVFYVLDSGWGRVQEFTVPVSTSEPAAAPSTGSAALTTVAYNVPVSGTGAPQALSSSEVAKWGQYDDPMEGVAIFPPDKPEGWPAPEADYKRAAIYYYDQNGHIVNVAAAAGGVATTEYNEAGDVTRELSPVNRASALAEGAKAAEVSHLLDDQHTYSTDGTQLLSDLGPRHTVKLANGEEIAARQHTVYSYDEGAPEGGPYNLVTKVTDGAQIEGKPEADVRTTTTSYSGQEGLGWKLREPTSVTTDPSGLKLTKTYVYDSATGNLLESRKPASGGEGNAHDVRTVYYTAAANGTYPTCGEHAEWANMPCETLPGAQPETSGIPNLPITTTTYNYLLLPSVTTATVGSDSRTTTNTYDEAGRLTKAAISSTVGTALPTVTDEYDSKTGLLVKEKTTVEGVTTSLLDSYNALAQLTSYTDADGTSATYEYDVDGRTTSSNDGKGTQTYKYSATTGLETELVDSAAGTFKATYDVAGHILTEVAPDGITSRYAYNAIDDLVQVEDKKTTSCGSSCTWFNDTMVPSIHGQEIARTNTLAVDSYKYDEAGRLVEVKETPVGQGCVTRLYAYDTEFNRTSLTSREPGAEGKCATEGGTVASKTFDSGNRLTDTGVKYDALGDTTVMPAADAAGSELTTTFYSNSHLASVTQASQTVSYHLDPAGRAREIVSTGTVSSTVVNHYAGGGDSPSWTVDLAGKWTRNISGIAGELVAVQTNGEAPIMQLTDLVGNVVATASQSKTATALLSTIRSTEYGVPTTGAPPKYSWLGGFQRSTELTSGVVAMGARGYVPQIGRFLQADPVLGGSNNPYAYTDGDPVNSSDLGGDYVENDYLETFNEEENERAIERELARQEAAREEAERKAEEAAAAAEEAAERAAASGGGRHHATARHARRGGKTFAVKRLSAKLCESCKYGKLKLVCDAKCHKRRKRELKEEQEKKRKKEEIEKQVKEEEECGEVRADYSGRAGSDLNDGVYYPGHEKRLGIVCVKEPGPGVDPPCPFGCDGGLEAWQQWPGEEGIDPRQRSLSRGSARTIRV